MIIKNGPDNQEKIFLQNIATTPSIPGDYWYIISKKWYLKWKLYVEFDEDDDIEKRSPPQQIDNTPLLKNGAVDHTLLLGFDYELIPEATWNFLAERYGCVHEDQKLFRREVIRLKNGNCEVEVAPFCLRLCSYRETIRPTHVYFSKLKTLHDVFKEMKGIFFPASPLEKRVLRKNDKGEFVLVEMSDDIILEDSGLDRKELLIIEEKAANDSWELQLTSEMTNGSKHHSSYLNGGASSSSMRASSAICPSEALVTHPGVCGLSNLGNTCFMNSAIQCVSNVARLTEYFRAGIWESDLNEDNPLGMQGHIASTYARLIDNIWSGQKTSAITRDFKRAVSEFAPQFTGYSQHDSHELLVFLLDGLHEDLNRITKKPYIEIKDAGNRPDAEVAAESWQTHLARNESVIVSLFHGMLKSTVVCPTCNYISVTFDPFSNLSLPLPVSSTKPYTVSYVAADPKLPVTRIKVEVRQTGCIQDLCNKVGKLMTCNPKFLVVADIYQHKIYNRFHMTDFVSKIMTNDAIYVYEVPHDPDTEMVLPICMNLQSGSYYSSSDNFFDHPQMLVVPRGGFSFIDLANIVEDRIQLCLSALPKLTPEEEALWKSGRDPEGDENGDIGDQMDITEELDDPELLKKVLVAARMAKLVKFQIGEKFHYQDVPVSCDPTKLIPFKAARDMFVLLNWTRHSYDNFYKETFKVSHESINRSETHRLALPQCFAQFTQAEQLGKNDLWYCRKCKEQKAATKKFDLWDLPTVLVLHLKRFRYNSYYREKIESLVEFPIRDLDLTEWVNNPKPSEPPIYDLVAVSNHMGGLGGGHYTAYAQNYINKKWYHFDDSYVSEARESDIVSKSAYVLVYVRKNKNSSTNGGDLMDVE